MSARPPAHRGQSPASAPRGNRSGARSDASRRDAIEALLAPVVASTGLILEDVELRAVGRRIVLRVLVDSESGVSLDQVATTSHAVSDALDLAAPLGADPFTLEVSSPGIDRPLTLPRHWQRNVGRLVAITLADGREVTGRLVTAGETAVELEVNAQGRMSTRTVALAEIRRALVQVEFSRVESADLGDDSDHADDPSDATDTDDTGDTDTDTETDTTETEV